MLAALAKGVKKNAKERDAFIKPLTQKGQNGNMLANKNTNPIILGVRVA